MNERLKELYEQAHERKPVMVVDPQTGNLIQAGWANKPMYGNEFNPEKFAELIVRECSGIADTYAKGGAGSEFDVGYMLCAQTLSVEIKQHFGVEE